MARPHRLRARRPPPPPTAWARPGLVMTFNLECPGCVSRGIPFLKRLHAEFGDSVHLLAVHTSHGHRLLPGGEVVPTLQKFARDYAKLPFPVALDLSGDLARTAHRGHPALAGLRAGRRTDPQRVRQPGERPDQTPVPAGRMDRARRPCRVVTGIIPDGAAGAGSAGARRSG
ncbi:hypothetical protein [Deinococcus aquaticus]|uniref:hypothetical protein n=1 Tax=Deinococcus aquaticus TaxID=328692 RepID=UPI00361E3219